MKMRGRSRHGERQHVAIYRGSPGEKIGPKASGRPVDADHPECPVFHAGVRLRISGLLRGHSIGGGTNRAPHIPCLGTGMSPVAAPETAVA